MLIYLNVAKKYLHYLDAFAKYIHKFARVYVGEIKDRRTGELKRIYAIFNKEALQFIDSFISEHFLKDISQFVAPGRYYKPHSARLHRDAAESIKQIHDKYGKIIKLNYGYRPVGETCGNDKNGARDATDIYGHWTGFSIDIGFTQEAHKALEEHGWFRPYEEEDWHYQFRQ